MLKDQFDLGKGKWKETDRIVCVFFFSIFSTPCLKWTVVIEHGGGDGHFAFLVSHSNDVLIN